jgi:hypothetical protein
VMLLNRVIFIIIFSIVSIFLPVQSITLYSLNLSHFL